MPNAFINHLESLREDRAALAALRRGLGKPPGAVAATHPHVVPFLPRDLSQWEEDRFYLVATLFAMHPEPGAGIERNMGAHFAALASRDNRESVERRFVALLNANREDLPDHLRHAVNLLKSNDIAINWDQLLNDLRWWDMPERRVQRDWARAFWKPREPREDKDSQSENADEIDGANAIS